MDPILSIARPAILNLTPYRSARSMVTSGEVFLDANEFPWSPCLDSNALNNWNRYPEPQPKRLLDRLARLYGTHPEKLFVGRGSDDAIDALTRVFCEAGRDSVVICPPTYGVYEVSANIQGTMVIRVPLKRSEGFLPDVSAIVGECRKRVKLLFLCSPNNPTGNLIPHDTIESLCEALHDRSVIVVDEAYIEFSDAPSAIALLERFPNLVILRTLSKAWGLAGARCGVAVGHEVLVGLLNKVRAPYPISIPSLEAVESVLSVSSDFVRRYRAVILSERERVSEFLKGSALVDEVFPSRANFVLVRFGNSSVVMEESRRQGIILRDRGQEPGLTNCIRITIGRPEENDRLMKLLTGLESKHGR